MNKQIKEGTVKNFSKITNIIRRKLRHLIYIFSSTVMSVNEKCNKKEILTLWEISLVYSDKKKMFPVPFQWKPRVESTTNAQ